VGSFNVGPAFSRGLDWKTVGFAQGRWAPTRSRNVLGDKIDRESKPNWGSFCALATDWEGTQDQGPADQPGLLVHQCSDERNGQARSGYIGSYVLY